MGSGRRSSSGFGSEGSDSGRIAGPFQEHGVLSGQPYPENPMRTLRSQRLAVAALLLGVAASASAQEYKSATGIKREIIAQIDDAGRKFIQLAEAMPADKYSWRPAPGVRSVGEVYMHIVSANFMIP